MKELLLKVCNYLPYKLPEDGKFVINTLNPHSYCVAKEDGLFCDALLSSNILIPDGIGVVWASKYLFKKRIKKISGFDLHLHYLKMLQKKGGGKVFYLGASEQTLALIEDRLKREFPLIQAEVYSPPFKSEFTQEENLEMIREINQFEPDVLFVGMTAPKQEKWVFIHKNSLNVKMVCSIGAVFDFYAGTVQRSNEVWINLGLEWLPRFLKEPKRLWRRNLISTPQFIFDVIQMKLRI